MPSMKLSQFLIQSVSPNSSAPTIQISSNVPIICMYACMYVCMHACMHVCTYVYVVYVVYIYIYCIYCIIYIYIYCIYCIIYIYIIILYYIILYIILYYMLNIKYFILYIVYNIKNIYIYIITPPSNLRVSSAITPTIQGSSKVGGGISSSVVVVERTAWCSPSSSNFLRTWGKQRHKEWLWWVKLTDQQNMPMTYCM